jgi:nitrile hydratase accessory protein
VNLDVDGQAAPPRRTGELVFAETWESRAFGMAVSLCEAGVFAWSDFQSALIERISQWEKHSDGTQPWRYYDHWLGALTDVLNARALVTADALAEKARTLARRPAGHDHRH